MISSSENLKRRSAVKKNMAPENDSDSDGAPEEFTFEQGSKQDEEIRGVQKENKERVVREKKERRRLWAKRKTQQRSIITEATEEKIDEEDSVEIPGMLPVNVVSFLADREKIVFTSESEEETVENTSLVKRKKQKLSSQNGVLFLKDLPPAPCAAASMEFLKRRKMQVTRSQAALSNADKAFRLLSARGNLLSKS